MTTVYEVLKMSGKKIRAIHYCNQLSLGGTEKTMELFCKYLPKETYETYVISRKHSPPLATRLRVGAGALLGHGKSQAKQKLWKSMNARIPNFTAMLAPGHLLFANSDEHLHEVIASLKPDVLHVHYSGRPEAPTSDESLLAGIPVTVTTNQFELHNTSAGHKHVKKMLFVSRWLLENKAHWAKQDPRADVLYNPVENPMTAENLRASLGIQPGTFVIGRVGRPDPGIHDSISLEAYAGIENENTLFLALSPPTNMVEEAKRLRLKNFRALPPTTDALWLSKFYNTIDVLAHARKDGETFGCNIAEAMIHGKPVVSHISRVMDAQIEVIGDTGKVVAFGDTGAYQKQLQEWRDDKELLREAGKLSRARAEENFEASRLTERLDRIYKELL